MPRSSFKGFARVGFDGFVDPRPPSTVPVVNSGLAMPAPVSHGAFSTDLDGRKLYLPDGGWLILPDTLNATGEFYTCYNAGGTQRWQIAPTDISASQGREWTPHFFLDTAQNKLYVGTTDANIFSTSTAYAFTQAAIAVDTGAISAISQSTAVGPLCLASGANAQFPVPLWTPSTLNSAMRNSRAASYTFRDGLGTGNFRQHWLGEQDQGAAFSLGATGIPVPSWSSNLPIGGSQELKSGSLYLPTAGYQGANGDIWIDYFRYAETMRIARRASYGIIPWSKIPGDSPTFDGGQAGTNPYTAGILPVNWNLNEVGLVGFTTELIFGQRYYKRNEFDAWLHRIADFLALPT